MKWNGMEMEMKSELERKHFKKLQQPIYNQQCETVA